MKKLPFASSILTHFRSAQEIKIESISSIPLLQVVAFDKSRREHFHTKNLY